MKRKKNPELAAVLSLLVPGIGQIYCFRLIWGILWLIFTAGIWTVATVFGFIPHLLAAWQAYAMAKKRNR